MSKHIGSSLESLFDETGEREQFERITLKKVIAERVRARMKQRGVNQTQLARAMHTNRLQVQRLLDASHTSLTLSTLARVTSLLGLKLDLVPKVGTPVPKKGVKLAAGKPARRIKTLRSVG